MVGIVARFWGIRDHTSSGLDGMENVATQPLVDRGEESDQRAWLTRLWSEICELPVAQRQALLLNLRDENGDSALELAPMAGIASIREIAGILQMEDSELAALWNRLPIDDLAIAERLSVTRQQVINLRKAARARLSRRMGSL